MRADHTDTPQVHTLPRERQTQPNEEKDEAHISLIELWRILVEERRVIGAIMAGTIFIALLFAIFSPPVYQANVLLAPADPAKDSGMASAVSAQLGGFAQLAGINLNSTNTEENIAILKSRSFAEEFIRKENLMPILFEDRWDARRGQWKSEKPFFLVAWIKNALNAIRPGRPGTSDNIPTAGEAYRKFSKIRSVSTDAISGLVTLNVEWNDPQLAADWANKLVDRLNNHVRLWTREEAVRSQQYINRQLAQTGLTEMQQILHRLLEEQVKTVMLTGIRTEFAFRIVDPAVVPERPVWPQPLLLLVIGFTLGGLAGVSAALVRAYIRKETKTYTRVTGEKYPKEVTAPHRKSNPKARRGAEGQLSDLGNWAARAVRGIRSGRSPARPLPTTATAKPDPINPSPGNGSGRARLSSGKG